MSRLARVFEKAKKNQIYTDVDVFCVFVFKTEQEKEDTRSMALINHLMQKVSTKKLSL